MRFKKTFNIDIELVVNILHYVPARQAPACSNPSDPLFSDSGDPEELEYALYILDDDGKINMLPDSVSKLYEILYDEILEWCEDNYDSRR